MPMADGLSVARGGGGPRKVEGKRQDRWVVWPVEAGENMTKEENTAWRGGGEKPVRQV